MTWKSTSDWLALRATSVLSAFNKIASELAFSAALAIVASDCNSSLVANPDISWCSVRYPLDSNCSLVTYSSRLGIESWTSFTSSLVANPSMLGILDLISSVFFSTSEIISVTVVAKLGSSPKALESSCSVSSASGAEPIIDSILESTSSFLAYSDRSTSPLEFTLAVNSVPLLNVNVNVLVDSSNSTPDI